MREINPQQTPHPLTWWWGKHLKCCDLGATRLEKVVLFIPGLYKKKKKKCLDQRFLASKSWNGMNRSSPGSAESCLWFLSNRAQCKHARVSTHSIYPCVLEQAWLFVVRETQLERSLHWTAHPGHVGFWPRPNSVHLFLTREGATVRSLSHFPKETLEDLTKRRRECGRELPLWIPS